MYAIVSDGVLVSLCDKPHYVKLNEDNRCYVEADESEAIAVSVRGDLYNIHGGNTIPDAPQAEIVQNDGAEYVFQNRVRITENEESTAASIIEVENALCDLDTVAESKLTAIEDALCEMDSMMNGGKSNE